VTGGYVDVDADTRPPVPALRARADAEQASTLEVSTEATTRSEGTAATQSSTTIRLSGLLNL
jgi:hypothetical protein